MLAVFIFVAVVSVVILAIRGYGQKREISRLSKLLKNNEDRRRSLFMEAQDLKKKIRDQESDIVRLNHMQNTCKNSKVERRVAANQIDVDVIDIRDVIDKNKKYPDFSKKFKESENKIGRYPIFQGNTGYIPATPRVGECIYNLRTLLFAQYALDIVHKAKKVVHNLKIARWNDPEFQSKVDAIKSVNTTQYRNLNQELNKALGMGWHEVKKIRRDHKIIDLIRSNKEWDEIKSEIKLDPTVICRITKQVSGLPAKKLYDTLRK